MPAKSLIELEHWADAPATNLNGAWTGRRFTDGASIEQVVSDLEKRTFIEEKKLSGRSKELSVVFAGYMHDPTKMPNQQRPRLLHTITSIVFTPKGKVEIPGSAQFGCTYRCVTCPSSIAKPAVNQSPEQIFGQVWYAHAHAGKNPYESFSFLLTGEGDNGVNAENVLAAIAPIKQAFPGFERIRFSSLGHEGGLDKLIRAIPSLPKDVRFDTQLSLHFDNDTDRKEWSPTAGSIDALLRKGVQIRDAFKEAGRPEKVRLNWAVFPGKGNNSATSAAFLAALPRDVFYVALVQNNEGWDQAPAWSHTPSTPEDLAIFKERIDAIPGAPETVIEVDWAARILGAGCAQVTGGQKGNGLFVPIHAI